MFHASILTIFPEMFPGPLQYPLAGRALRQNIWSHATVNLRDFGITKHQNVDDVQYGGGNGLVMRADVVGAAMDQALQQSPGCHIYYPSPRGKAFTQAVAKEIATKDNIIILCGRFEGIDERIIDEYNVIELSMGDYILSGGELAALTMLDCVIRLLPGVLANSETLLDESFEDDGDYVGLLEPPLYTKPSVWRRREVPDILLSGNHGLIKKWRKEQSELITRARRSDLLSRDRLS